jgi:hypothetical protein
MIVKFFCFDIHLIKCIVLILMCKFIYLSCVYNKCKLSENDMKAVCKNCSIVKKCCSHQSYCMYLFTFVKIEISDIFIWKQYVNGWFRHENLDFLLENIFVSRPINIDTKTPIMYLSFSYDVNESIEQFLHSAYISFTHDVNAA